MPGRPAPQPRSPLMRILAPIRGACLAVPLFLAVLVCNVLQMSSMVFYPFSPRLFRRSNREIANAWWCMGDWVGDFFYGIDIVITGDPIPLRENALVVCNHQTMADITTLFRLARQKKRLGDLKWLVKDGLKYVPGIGWGMVFLDCIFLKRNWNRDEGMLARTFGRFQRNQIPIWTISFVEGTRMRPHKLKSAQAYAQTSGLPTLHHLLTPRTKGFVAVVNGLRTHLDAVYDATIAYEGGVPSLWQWVKGSTRRVQLHVERHPIDTLPSDEEAMKAWLHQAFETKDARLEHFYTQGSLVKPPETEASD